MKHTNQANRGTQATATAGYDFAAPDMTAAGAIDGAAYWDLGIPASTVAGQTPFTIEAWIAADTPNAGTAIFAVPGFFAFGLSGGLLSAEWSGGSGVTGTTQVDQAWHYVAVTWDGTQMRLYLDGAPEGTAAAAAPGGTPPPGNCRAGSGGTDSPVDVWGIAVYDLARTADDEGAAPWADLTVAPGMVSSYDFSVAPAQVLYPPDGTVTAMNGATSVTVAPAIRLDGNSAGIAVWEQQGFAAMSAYSISAWISVDDPSSQQQQVIFSAGEMVGNPGRVGFGLTGNGLYAQHGNDPVVQATGSRLAPNEWHNVAVTCDGATLTIFLDGAAQASGPVGALGQDVPPYWEVGYGIVGGQKTNWLAGYVQWLSVWSRALSAEEVASQMYQEVAGDPQIVVDVPLDTLPLVDVANGTGIQLGGGAGLQVQRRPVTSWRPPPEQQEPSAMQADRSPRRDLTAVSCPVARMPARPEGTFQEVELPTALAAAESFLTELPPEIAGPLRQRIEVATRAAFEQADRDPRAFAAIAEWQRDGDDDVFIHHHPDGDQELLRLPVGSATDCFKWWISFLFTAIFGVIELIGFAVTGKYLSEWLQRRVLNDLTVMEALAEALRTQPIFTVGVLLKVLAILNSFGLLKSVLWTVVWKAGWFALTRAFVWLAVLLVAAPWARVAEFTVRAAVLAAQLAVAYTGAPGIQGYRAACGSQAISA